MSQVLVLNGIQESNILGELEMLEISLIGAVEQLNTHTRQTDNVLTTLTIIWGCAHNKAGAAVRAWDIDGV